MLQASALSATMEPMRVAEAVPNPGHTTMGMDMVPSAQAATALPQAASLEDGEVTRRQSICMLCTAVVGAIP